jgi:hypothetical protein
MADEGEARPEQGEAGAEQRPTREEVETWVGDRLDEISGASMGKIEGAFVSEAKGRPEWILIRVGRFGHHTVVPARQAVAGVGHVWVPWSRATIRSAPRVELGGALNAEEERQLCEHYGIVTGQGRAADLAETPADDKTVVPLEA